VRFYKIISLKKYCLLLVALFILVYTAAQIYFLINEKSSSIEKTKSEIELRLESESPEKVYYEIKKEFLESSQPEQHQITHFLGKTFYFKYGLDGINYCDPAFSFGCFHGAFSQAIESEGLSIVSRLDEICEQKYGSSRLGCQHGIGHGILKKLGVDNLNESLNFCVSLSTDKARLECKTGVFMEYNFPSSHHHQGTSMRIDSSGIYSPCSGLSPEEQPACYYILPQWWDQLYKHDSIKLGNLCLALDSNNQDACFQGIGDIFANTTIFDPEMVIQKCSLMPDLKSSALCQGGARGIFHSVRQFKHLAPELCHNLADSSLQNLCLSKSNFFMVD
jgi:hypothetical protein